MRYCINCGKQLEDNVVFCPNCGTSSQGTGAAYVSPFDHSAEFDAEDVKQNKIYAMLIYLSGVIGIIIALLVSKDSAYIKFHVTQYVRFLIAFTLVSLAIAVLAFTVIIPIIGGVALAVLLVCDIISFFKAASGKSVEMPIVRSISFLK